MTSNAATVDTDRTDSAGSDFAALVGPLRPELRAHCYRMLGSVHDADEAVQEALIRAWRGLATFEGRSSLRNWLLRIATRTSLDLLQARGRRALPMDLGPASETIDLRDGTLDNRWLGPYPTQPQDSVELRESVELAFVAALQHLPGNQRAALLLFDVLDFSAAEIAEMMDTSVGSVTSALQRARATMATSGSTTVTAANRDDAAIARRVEQFAQALQDSDSDALVALLTEDVSWSMPPLPGWYAGREAVMTFARRVPLGDCGDWRYRTVEANGIPAVALYLRPRQGGPDDGSFPAWSINVVELDDEGRIGVITSFLGAEHFADFGLPDSVPAD